MKRLSPVFISLALVFACAPDDGADADTVADETMGEGDGDMGDGDGDTTGDGDGDTTTGDGDGDTGPDPVATVTGTVVGMAPGLAAKPSERSRTSWILWTPHPSFISFIRRIARRTGSGSRLPSLRPRLPFSRPAGPCSSKDLRHW